MTQASAKLGETLTIDKIVRAGNKILNIDGNEVAQAKCAANFIHIFLQTESGTRCVTMFDVRGQGTIDSHIGVECRLANGTKTSFLVR